jgi:hypothetical protein
MSRSGTLYVSLVGALAWSSTAIDAVLSALEAASFSAIHTSLRDIATAATALDAVSLFGIGFYIAQDLRRRDEFMKRSVHARYALVSCSALMSLVALAVSLALVAMIRSKLEEVTSTSTQTIVTDWNAHVSAHIAVWVISCASQIALYSSIWWNRGTPRVQSISVSGPRDSVLSEMQSAAYGKNIFTTKPTQPSSPLEALPSPTYSNRTSSQSVRSFRESLRHVVRPTTSRTALIGRHSFTRDTRSICSDAHSIENVVHSDGFDSWDTSSVSPQVRDAVMQTAPSRGTTLEAIPGSRCISPARALDGPFLPEIGEELTEEELAAPPRLMMDISRPPSPAVSEAHIHPLFRSESPVPPPAATPGTNILASPLSDQMIACPARPYNRMRSASHTTSPGVLVHAQSFQSLRGYAAGMDSPLRTPSPPGREMTPPIPDFIINPSPRSSSSVSRKVQLQHSS